MTVASILAAFAVDAWWGERQERRIEHDDLERLHTEFIWNRDRIDEFRLPTSVQAASAEIYELVSTHIGSDEPLDVQNEWIERIHDTPTFDSVTPVLDGLVLSGRLTNIRDPAVLTAIALWERFVIQVNETDLSAREFTQTQLAPALMRRGNMGPAYSNAAGTTALRVDDEIVGILAARLNSAEFVLRMHDQLRTSANDVILAIEDALAEE